MATYRIDESSRPVQSQRGGSGSNAGSIFGALAQLNAAKQRNKYYDYLNEAQEQRLGATEMNHRGAAVAQIEKNRKSEDDFNRTRNAIAGNRPEFRAAMKAIDDELSIQKFTDEEDYKAYREEFFEQGDAQIALKLPLISTNKDSPYSKAEDRLAEYRKYINSDLFKEYTRHSIEADRKANQVKDMLSRAEAAAAYDKSNREKLLGMPGVSVVNRMYMSQGKPPVPYTDYEFNPTRDKIIFYKSQYKRNPKTGAPIQPNSADAIDASGPSSLSQIQSKARSELGVRDDQYVTPLGANPRQQTSSFESGPTPDEAFRNQTPNSVTDSPYYGSSSQPSSPYAGTEALPAERVISGDPPEGFSPPDLDGYRQDGTLRQPPFSSSVQPYTGGAVSELDLAAEEWNKIKNELDATVDKSGNKGYIEPSGSRFGEGLVGNIAGAIDGFSRNLYNDPLYQKRRQLSREQDAAYTNWKNINDKLEAAPTPTVQGNTPMRLDQLQQPVEDVSYVPTRSEFTPPDMEGYSADGTLSPYSPSPQYPFAQAPSSGEFSAMFDSRFDPEGSGYDYETARAYGLEPDENGKWPSRVPETGQILKGRNHPTFDQTVQSEAALGNQIFKGSGGSDVNDLTPYFSEPTNAPYPYLGQDVADNFENQPNYVPTYQPLNPQRGSDYFRQAQPASSGLMEMDGTSMPAYIPPTGAPSRGQAMMASPNNQPNELSQLQQPVENVSDQSEQSDGDPYMDRMKEVMRELEMKGESMPPFAAKGVSSEGALMGLGDPRSRLPMVDRSFPQMGPLRQQTADPIELNTFGGNTVSRRMLPNYNTINQNPLLMEMDGTIPYGEPPISPQDLEALEAMYPDVQYP